MSIQRVPPVPFTQIANSALRDKRLSFKARGLLAMVLTNIGEWNATLNWICAQSDHDGRAAVQAALNELTELGYRSVSTTSDGKGGLSKVVTWRHEPEVSILRPMNNSTDVKPDGRKTGATLEEHSLEHHLSEHQAEPLPPLRDDVEALCNLLAELIEANGSKRPTITKAWRDAARLMLDRDERSFNDAMTLVRWCQQDEFWRSNVLSMPTFRKQYDRLRLKSQQQHSGSNMQGHMALIRETAYTEGYEVPDLEVGALWT